MPLKEDVAKRSRRRQPKLETPHSSKTQLGLKKTIRLAGIWVLMLMIAPQLTAHAQTSSPNTRLLSLDEALHQAAETNYMVRNARADVHVARAGVSQSRATFLPHLSISEIATTTNDPLNAFGFKLKQEVVTQADFNPALLNNPDRIDQLTTRFEFQQPVFNPAGIARHRAARSQSDAALYAEERTRHHVDFQVKQTYFQLVLAQRSLAVIDSALVAARTNQAQACRVYDQGLITRADLLAADVRVLDLESKRTEAAFAIQNTSDALRNLLGIDDAITIIPTDALAYSEFAPAEIDIKQVNLNRSDMRAMQAGTKSARFALRANQSQFIPSFNVFGSYELNDKDLFGNSGQSYAFGAILKWNLFAGYRQIGSVEQARANLLKSELALEHQQRQNDLDIEMATRGIEQAQQQLKLAQAAVDHARENLRIRSDRYAQGLEKTTDVLNAEVTLSNQQLTYLQTLYQHQVNIFRLELLLEQSVTQ